MNQLYRLYLLLAVFAVSCVHAAPIEQSLWKIEKVGEPTSYLVGTIHIGRSGTTLSPALQQIVADSDALMTEVLAPSTPRKPHSLR